VTIVRDDGREQTFRIVGEDEADPAKGSISHVSPLARSMFGKRVGDVVRAGNGEAENHPDPLTNSLALSSLAEGCKPVAFAYDHRGEEVGEGVARSALIAAKF